MSEQLSTQSETQPHEAAIRARSRTARRHVLIVDNNPVMGRILGKVLDRAGLQFTIAQTGEEAVTFCSSTNYDLILMEVRMPGIGGTAAARQIRESSSHYQEIPIVAVSAQLSPGATEKYVSKGFTDTLKKPVIELNLMQSLAKHLGIKKDAASRKPPEDDQIYAVLDEDELSLLNWDTIKEYNSVLKGDYKTLMRDFLVASPDLIGEIGEAVVDKNGKKIEYLAHKLKSTSLIFGAENVSNIAAQLEILGRKNELTHTSQFYKELHMSFERIKPVLRKKLILLNSPV
jgi:CheY-like chemotaxis protein/HPt (histidine-containing phosphotransfer) domain-containing protein